MVIKFQWKLKNTYSSTYPKIDMKRWGGGWDFKLGIAISRSELLLELGIALLTFRFKKLPE